MRAINDYWFYQLGTILHPLLSINKDQKAVDIVFDLWTAQDWLEFFLLDKIVPLNVCKGPGWRLLGHLKEITSRINDAAEMQKPLAGGPPFRLVLAKGGHDSPPCGRLKIAHRDSGG